MHTLTFFFIVIGAIFTTVQIFRLIDWIERPRRRQHTHRPADC